MSNMTVDLDTKGKSNDILDANVTNTPLEAAFSLSLPTNTFTHQVISFRETTELNTSIEMSGVEPDETEGYKPDPDMGLSHGKEGQSQLPAAPFDYRVGDIAVDNIVLPPGYLFPHPPPGRPIYTNTTMYVRNMTSPSEEETGDRVIPTSMEKAKASREGNVQHSVHPMHAKRVRVLEAMTKTL